MDSIFSKTLYEQLINILNKNQEFLKDSINGNLFQKFIGISCFIGIFKFFNWTFQGLKFINRQFLRPHFQSQNYLYEKYGNKDQNCRSWAVITGGSDGIGLAMCKLLALQGFNICIIARDEQKMIEKLKEINFLVNATLNKKIQTMYIVSDFSKMNSIEEYEEIVQNNLRILDIGIVILNAGVGSMGPFNENQNIDIQTSVNVNALQVIYFSKVIVNQLLKRYDDHKQKSGILVTSSLLGERPFPGMLTYSASKSLAGFIAEGLNFELQGKVDVLNYCPSQVSTKLLGIYQTDYRTISPQRAAESSLRDLGFQNKTNGAIRHEIWKYYLFSWPERNVQAWMYNLKKAAFIKKLMMQEKSCLKSQ